MDDPNSPSLPPPGWYPEPGQADERFWDGSGWTAQTRVALSQGTSVSPRGGATEAAPPAQSGWYPNPAGPGVRFWNGERWTESEVPVVVASSLAHPAIAQHETPPPTITQAPPPRGDESRRQRARRLGKVSVALLRQDPRLIAFPVVSTLVSVVIGVAAVVISLHLAGGTRNVRSIGLTVGIIASYPIMFVTLFSSVALACTLGRILSGETVTAADGWRDARERAGLIAKWTLVVCTVGAVIRLLEERLPFGGRVAAALAGISWGLATVFAVPVIAYERLGPGATLRRSSELFRRRWGAQVGGSIVIAAGTAAVAIPAVLVLVIGIATGGAAGVMLIAVAGGALLALQAFSVTLTQVYRIFLYRDTVGAAGGGGPYATADLERPFRGKKRWFH